MSRLVRNHVENADYMKVLCAVRDQCEKLLTKHGEPRDDRSRIINVLTEELGEMAQVYLSEDSDERYDEELVDLVAYGIVVLHRRALKRKGLWPHVDKGASVAASKSGSIRGNQQEVPPKASS